MIKIKKIKKILLICAISFFLSLIPIKIIANMNNILTDNISNITIDVNNILSDVSNNPVGINMNFLKDNTQITKSLESIKLGTLRYPMGEVADNYLFDKDNPAQPKVAINDLSLGFSKLINSDGTWKSKLSFDDFMSICKSLKVEPFIVIGIDAIAYTGTSPHASLEKVMESAVEWVRYANIIKGYDIKYWEIGNETDLTKDKLYWTAEKYADIFVQFSRAMKTVDPSIKIGANGMSSGLEWWDRVMPIVKNDVDFLITHQYSSIQNYEQWKNNNWNYTSNIETANKTINTYNPKLKLNVTENSSRIPSINHRNNTWKMLHNFEILGNTIRFNQVDYYHFWVTKWFDPDPYYSDASAFNSNYELIPMGIPLKIWGDFLKKKMVFSSKLGTIRSWASYDPEDNSLNVFLLNKDEVSQDISLTLNNYTGNIQNERWILKGSTPESTDVTWEKSSSVSVNGSRIKTELEPLSVTVITFQ